MLTLAQAIPLCTTALIHALSVVEDPNPVGTSRSSRASRASLTATERREYRVKCRDLPRRQLREASDYTWELEIADPVWELRTSTKIQVR